MRALKLTQILGQPCGFKVIRAAQGEGGRGGPRLGGATAVSTTRLIGFRTLAFVNRMYTAAGDDAGYTGGPRLFYRVNGVPIFVRGTLIILTRTSYYESFTVSGTGYNDNTLFPGANVVTLDVLESRVARANRHSSHFAAGRARSPL